MIQKQTQTKSKTDQDLPSFFYYLSLALIPLGILAAIASLWLKYHSDVRFLPDIFSLPHIFHEKNFVIPCICLLCYLIHFLPLALIRRLSTRSARARVAIPIVSILCALLIAFGYFLKQQNTQNQPNYPWMFFMVWLGLMFVPILLWINCLIVFSMPCTFLSSLPLLMFYLIIAMIMIRPSCGVIVLAFYIPLAGFLFPRHRRLAEYWRPTRLPRIKLTKPTAN